MLAKLEKIDMPTISPLDQPDIVPVTNDPTYTLRTQCVYTWGDYTYDIAPGFEFDGMSIPRYLWSVAGLYPDGIQRLAAMIHDFTYGRQGQMPNNIVITRETADERLRDMCIASGVGRTKANAIYLSVKEFGWIYWNKHNLTYAGLHPHKTTHAELKAYSKHYQDELKKHTHKP